MKFHITFCFSFINEKLINLCSRFRAKIMSLNPLKVAFIDFGNVENCQLSDLKILPNKYFKINDLVSQPKDFYYA